MEAENQTETKEIEKQNRKELLRENYIKYMNMQELEINTINTYMLHFHKLVELDPPTKQGIRDYLGDKFNTNTSRPALKKWIEFYSDMTDDTSYFNLRIPKSKRRIKDVLPKHLTFKQIMQIKRDKHKLTKFEFMIILILIDTGLRATELVTIKKENLLLDNNKDFDGGYIIVPNSVYGSGIKTGGRRIAVRKETKDLILDYLMNRGYNTPYLMPFRTRQRLYQIIRKAGHKLYGEEFYLYPHMLRHTTGFIAINANKPLRQIQEYLGHKSMETTTIYTKLDTRKVSEFWSGIKW